MSSFEIRYYCREMQIQPARLAIQTQAQRHETLAVWTSFQPDDDTGLGNSFSTHDYPSWTIMPFVTPGKSIEAQSWNDITDRH